jgi:hypothetical protein
MWVAGPSPRARKSAALAATNPGNSRLQGLLRTAWGMMFCCLLALSPADAAEPAVTKEQQVRAAFLYNFTKFVEWPEEKFADTNAPIVIGVLGRNPFGSALTDTVRDRKVNGRVIQVRQIANVSEVRGLHVLFLSGGETARFDGLENALREASVLGVGESETFLQRGGTIRFVLEEDKVRFEIDMRSAERAKLKISSQLQRLARTVNRNP